MTTKEKERLKNERQNETLNNERTLFVQCERELKNESRTRGLRTGTRTRTIVQCERES